MEHKKFSDIIECVKINSCSACQSYKYTLPIPITQEIDSYLLCFGPLKYQLSKVNIIKIDNDFIRIDGTVGGNQINVKYKKDLSQKKVFDTQISAYIQSLMNISITF